MQRQIPNRFSCRSRSIVQPRRCISRSLRVHASAAPFQLPNLPEEGALLLRNAEAYCASYVPAPIVETFGAERVGQVAFAGAFVSLLWISAYVFITASEIYSGVKEAYREAKVDFETKRPEFRYSWVQSTLRSLRLGILMGAPWEPPGEESNRNVKIATLPPPQPSLVRTLTEKEESEYEAAKKETGLSVYMLQIALAALLATLLMQWILTDPKAMTP